jgi:hypothetical protein
VKDPQAHRKRVENLKRQAAKVRPIFFVDRNHNHKVMGVACITRKHDLDFVCTVEQTFMGEYYANKICDLLNNEGNPKGTT